MKKVIAYENSILNFEVAAYIFNDAEVVDFDTSKYNPEVNFSDSLLHLMVDGYVVSVLRDGFESLQEKYSGDFLAWYESWYQQSLSMEN